jgi:serine phosphatase RsbU (regulator of sigma subunit)
MMHRPTISKDERLPDSFLLAPGSGFRHYRWVVLTVSVVLEIAVVLLDRWMGASGHHLPPVESLLVLISALAGALAGVVVGVGTALVAVAAAFLLLADFGATRGTIEALLSAAIWCLAAAATGVVASRLRRQVARRSTALEMALSLSVNTRDTLERVLDLSPHLLEGRTLAEVARIACESAIDTFQVDGARVFKLKGATMELLAICPRSEKIRAGYSLPATDIPDLEIMMARRRPLFVRDVGDTRPAGSADKLRQMLGIVSTVRLPLVGPTGPAGVLSLGWNHAVERPDDELLAVMQHFADQVAIAWHNALRLEAQHRADDLHRILDRVVKLAPTFHITGPREAVAKAICRAALSTFGCSGAALYRVEGDRLHLLDRMPPLASMSPGRAFPLTRDMPLASELRSHKATFVPDVSHPSRSFRPWPQEVVSQAGTRSALYVPLRFDKGEPANLLVLTWKKPRRVPDEGFLVVVQRFVDQAALALAHASAERLHARLEASLIPTAPVDHPLLKVVTRYRTGEQRLRLGGDFVGSTVSAQGLLSFVLGDVSGHGPDAAALGATLRSTWKALTLAGQSLSKIADIMADLILAEGTSPNAFATILAGRIDADKGQLSWINAGHLPPLLITDRVITLESTPSPPLGIGNDPKRGVNHYRLPERWSLFCYTDGLIDIRMSDGPSQRYGEERLKERLAAWTLETPNGAALDALLEEIETGSGGRFADDVALLLISTKNDPQEVC